MQSKQKLSPSLDLQKEVDRAKWFKEDLEKGGWNSRYKVPGFNSWSKTFPEEEVPVKTLFMFQDMPMSAEKFAEIMHPSNMELRTQWDDAFKDLETLEVTPDEGRIVFTRVELSCPLRNRDLVLFVSPTREVDWYGKKAFAMFVKSATHPSKPEGGDGLVRAINGGNFYIAIPDDEEPQTKCNVFGLTNNNYNGWLPNTGTEWLVSRLAPRVFHKLKENVIQAYYKYFQKDEKQM